MVKSKKPKKPVNLKPEYVLDPKAEQVHRKKKKHAPDRPQPEWMFPPAEENPVLNPKTKSQERQDKEKRDHDHAIKFLKYKSVSTPLRAPPPAILLTLVGSFLTSYGFNSTSRLYTTELASRKKLDEWEVLIDQKLPKGFPDLVKLFKVGQKTYDEEERIRETSSSESDDNDTKIDTKSKKKKKAVQVVEAEEEETSSSSSDDSSGAEDPDEKMEEAPPITKAATGSVDRANQSGSSPSTSSSDSDADDEEEAAGAPLSKPKPSQIENGLPNAAKRKFAPAVEEPAKEDVRGRGGTGAVQLSSEEETSSEESVSNESEAAADVDVAGSKPQPTTAPISDPESDGTSASSESEAVPSTSSTAKPIKPTAVSSINTSTNKKVRTGSSSSETLQGTTTDQKTTTPGTSLSSSVVSSEPNSSDPAHDEPSAAKGQTSKLKRKHDDQDATPVSQKQQKKANLPFERVPKSTPVDDRFTNKYKSYDYADRAYQDLSVTKGKGFTKEKNKKKRGSYRGGAIDIGGGKGVKFDD